MSARPINRTAKNAPAHQGNIETGYHFGIIAQTGIFGAPYPVNGKADGECIGKPLDIRKKISPALIHCCCAGPSERMGQHIADHPYGKMSQHGPTKGAR